MTVYCVGVLQSGASMSCLVGASDPLLVSDEVAYREMIRMRFDSPLPAYEYVLPVHFCVVVGGVGPTGSVVLVAAKLTAKTTSLDIILSAVFVSVEWITCLVLVIFAR